MESKFGIQRIAVLFALALFVGMALPANAGVVDPGACHGVCKDDNKTCRSDARDAKRACIALCGDKACKRVCKGTFRSDLGACRENRTRCDTGCRPEIDQFCANVCIDDAVTCEGTADTCRPGCDANLAGELGFCDNFFNGDFGRETRGISEQNFDTKRECVLQAYAQREECKEECGSRRECNGDRRGCVEGCRGIVDD